MGCIHRPTRRTVLKMAGGMLPLLRAPMARAAVPDFTLAILPDTQYLAFKCTPIYNALMDRILADRTAWNIKCVIGVGDCNDTASAVSTAQSTATIAAYSRLDAAGMPSITCPGNHDYINPISSRGNLGWHFLAGNYFGADSRAAVFGSGMALGGGDMAYWVGSYDPSNANSGANTAIRLVIGTWKLLIIALEWAPRSGALNWAKDLHDYYAPLGYQVYVTMHEYLTGSTSSSTDPNQWLTWRAAGANYGGTGAEFGPAPAANSGVERWRGYTPGGNNPGDPSWGGFKMWSNLIGTFNGHELPGSGSYWVLRRLTSASSRAQSVASLFVNLQELDNVNYPADCPDGAPDNAADVAHVFYWKARPSLGTVEGYLLSANSGLWASGQGNASPTFCASASPVDLFGGAAYPWMPTSTALFPLPSPVGR